ncbi:ABC transporter family substrate-binding protein [Nocardioides marmoraquaticus]
MRKKRLFASAGVLASLTLIGTACSAPGTGDGGGDGGSGESSQPTSITLGWNQPFYSYNENSATGNATANSVIKYLMNNNFWYVDQEGNIQEDTDFGTYEQTSEDPLTVEYTVNEETTWSDGTPVDAADLLLTWAAQSGNVNDEGENGKVAFTGSSIGLSRVTEVPEISEDGKGLTLVYDQPFADWQYDMSVPVPAHVVAMNALGIDDPMEAKQALITAIQDDDRAALAKIAKFWNTGFDYTSFPDDENLALSNGAYVMTEMEENQFVTLERNDDFEGDKDASFDTITVRWEGDPLAQVQALQNGEIDMMAPQATVDLLQAAQQVENADIQTGDDGTYEHIDLVQNNGGPFTPEAYGGDAEKANQVRKAFLLAIPRQQIVERLIQPINPDAVVRDSFNITTGLAGYDEMIAENGSEEFAEPDPQAAQQLLQQAGVDTPIDVRFLFDPTNARRVSEFELLKPALAEAGFNLIDSSDPNWGELLAQSDTYDASLFGWQSTTLAVSASAENFVTGGQNNFTGYSNEEVDALYDQLVETTDEAEQLELQIQIEQQLFEDAFGITIFQFPGTTVSNETRVTNVNPGTLNPTMFYGFWDWEAPES